MNKTTRSKMVFSVFILLSFLSSCKIADISEQGSLRKEGNSVMAQRLLKESVDAQGFEVMQKKNTYEFLTEDDWPGLMGNMAKIWPNQKSQLSFRFNFNTFDGDVEFLDGEAKGGVRGIQSGNYYKKASLSEDIIIHELNEKNASEVFGLLAYHYFMELPFRLQSAPIKYYYGEEVKDGDTYYLVFATWGNEAATEEFDQYILWINRETHLVDYCIYTLRDNTNPITRKIYGSIAFKDYRNIDGFMVPFTMPVYLNDEAIRVEGKGADKYFHKLSLDSFRFSGFDEKELYPILNFPKLIDTK